MSQIRKINIGAGTSWFEEGWEVLDNGPGNYDVAWKHRGKCWDSKLNSNTYDIVFTCHMLEHVPHFRLEKTIAEFNRILKIGGTLRILVPDLKKAALAYVNGEESYFNTSPHYSDHLGIGGAFVRKLISPGGQTLAISREMDEILGSYAHLYGFDFDMLRILLEKWGFSDIRETLPGESAISELRVYQHLVCDGKTYDTDDDFVIQKKFLKQKNEWHFAGFDKTSRKSVCVEVKKVRAEPYSYDKEFSYNKNSRFGEGRLNHAKLALIRFVFAGVDGLYAILKALGIVWLLRRWLRPPTAVR